MGIAAVDTTMPTGAPLGDVQTARRYEVRRARRPDPMSISRASDFCYRFAEEVDAFETLESPDVSLYCLNLRRREAVFVECDSDVILEDYPFYYQGQFANAKRAIVMPLSTFQAVAQLRGDRFRHAVMIHSVGRCGSTLLSKMFGKVEQCLSLSEPDVHSQLIAEELPADEAVAMLRSTHRFYYQPHSNGVTHLVLKFRSFCVELAKQMELATPSARSLFLYRDAERVVRSGMRVFCYCGAPLWWVDQLHHWVVSRPILGAALSMNRTVGARLFPVIERFTSWELSQMGAVGIVAIAWLSAMERCVQLIRSGMRIHPLRYDDLIATPEAVTAALIAHCRLPPEAQPPMLAAMHDDSQRGSVIARERQRGYELSPRDKDTIRIVLARSEIIDGPDHEIESTRA